MKKLTILLLFLVFVGNAFCADTEVQDLTELTAVASTDVLYIVDDPSGTPASRRITVLNLFDIIDTFAELNTIVVGKTLVNEEDAVNWDALGTFGLGITITTGDPFTLGINRIDNGSDLLDGEMIAADTIDDDSIDWADCTFADFDFETNWKMWYSDGIGDVTELTLGANGTFLESNGADQIPAFRTLVDGDIPDNITVDLATLATTLTITDNESTAENNPIVFVAGAAQAGGNLGLESDGTFYYTPSTGTITTTQFVGGGAGLTSVDAITGDSATAFFDAGTIEHEYGGLEADINAYTGLVAITGGSTAEVDSKSELEGHIADVADFAEADGDTWSGTHDLSGATVTMPQRTANDERFYLFNLFNPNSLYDTDTQICIDPNTEAALTITEVQVTCDADPTTELDIDLKFADAFIGLANATLIEPIDTTTGTTDIDSGFDDATVPAGKCLYVEFGADPDSNIKQAIVKIKFDYD